MKIKITKEQKEKILRQKEVLIKRIEIEENVIPYTNMLRIVSKVNDRFSIILEDLFEEVKK